MLLLCAGSELASGQTTVPVGLQWTANTEPDLAGYKVYQSTVSGQYAAPIATIPKGTLTWSGLLPASSMDQRFYFSITAYDLASNESAKSTEVSKLVPAVPVAVKPGQPVLHITARTTTTMTIAWDPVPDGLGGAGIASVAVRIAPTPIQWGAASDSPCPVSPCTITGLAPDTSYDIQSVAYRGALNAGAVFGPLSAIVTGKTLPIDAPPAKPSGLIISKATVDEVVILASLEDCKSVATSIAGSTAAMAKRTVSCKR